MNWDDVFGDQQPESHQELSIEQCLNAGSQGVFISNEHYHALEGISGSGLQYLLESNKHYDNRKLFVDSNSPALAFGSLFHTLVLEPDQFQARYVVLPDFNLRSNDGKQKKSEFLEQTSNNGLVLITREDESLARKMARNVLAISGDIVGSGIKERSLFVDLDGVICKCRLDIDIEHLGDDYDLKSISLGTKDFSDKTLEHHIKKYGYHLSAALRNMVRRELGKPVRDSYLIFCNTGGGNMVRIVKISSDWIDAAQEEVETILSRRLFYLRTGIDNAISEITDYKLTY